MYAVIKTGGKQYRVRPGDLVVVEKLEGEPGAEIAFDQVLMIGEGPAVTVGAPIIAGASVSATLVETRKGKKIKVFKKIRRQGYRRTRGHRQFQSVLRVTGLSAGGKSETWDGTVDLTPLAVLNARARNLARGMEAAAAKAAKPAAEPKAVKAKAKSAPKKATAEKTPVVKAPAPEAAKPGKAAAKTSAPKKAAVDKPVAKKAAAPKKAPAEEPAVKKAAAKKTTAKAEAAAKPKPKAAKAKSAKD